MNQITGLIEKLSDKLVRAAPCFLRHDWSKWEVYAQGRAAMRGGIMTAMWQDDWQKRRCLGCGKTEKRPL